MQSLNLRKNQVSEHSMRLAEQQARRVVLTQAIEIADFEGKLLSDLERDQLDLRAVETARAATGADGIINVAQTLSGRAEQVLEAVGKRSGTLASLQNIPVWRSWLVWGIPLVALILGLATDLIANPHRVNLLSLPILIIVLWNMAVYALLLMALLRRKLRHPDPPLASLWRWVISYPHLPRRLGSVRVEASAQFLRLWHSVTADLSGQRIRQVLHFAAAAWGAGIALSLIARGVVVQYRIGWESTWFNAEQVHGILSILLMPLVALLSLEPFTLLEVSSMKFDGGADGAEDHGRRWVYLYAGLVMILVVLPRLLLAVVAWWRVRFLSHQVPIDLREPYFQRLIDRLIPAQVCLCVYSHRDEDRTALARVLVGNAEIGASGIIRTSTGDVLRMVDIPRGAHWPAPGTFWQKLLSLCSQPSVRELSAIGYDGDVVLHVVGEAGDLESAMALLRRLRQPVLVLANSLTAVGQSTLLAQCRLHQKHHDFITGVLSFDSFARCWVQDWVLLDELSQCMPLSKKQGFTRLVAAWNDRNIVRFKSSMLIIGAWLLEAAQQEEDVASKPLSVMNLLSGARRDAHEAAKSAAMAAVVKKLKQSEAAALLNLLKLHGIASSVASGLEQGLDVKFVVQSTFDTSQAGVAGAAAGATVGASVDMLTGGLTLGVAALLGALVGGSSAFLTAAWKNRTTASGVTTVQLTEEALQAMVGAALLRYLAIIHFVKDKAVVGIGEIRASWKNEMIAAVSAQDIQLRQLWDVVRAQNSPADSATRLANELEEISRRVLRNLYPVKGVL